MLVYTAKNKAERAKINIKDDKMSTEPSTSAPAPQTLTTSQQPFIVQQTLFGQDAVKQLTSADFTLDGNDRGRLKYGDCYLILFYAQNTESLDLVRIWQIVAAQTAGPLFGAVNLLVERKLAEAFMALRSDPDGPLHWASLRSIPYILVYRGGWPVAFYNGERAVQPLIDYSLTLACEANYREPTQLASGMQAENNYEMGGYQSSDVPKLSTDFSVQKPLRGFNPQQQPALFGSQAATTEAQQEQQERTAQSTASQAGVSTPISPS